MSPCMKSIKSTSFLVALIFFIIAICPYARSQEYEINPPFALEWLDHVSVLPQKANVNLRNATQEEINYILSRLSKIYRDIVSYVVDEYYDYGFRFKGYIFTTERTGKLTTVALFREKSSIEEFNNVCEKLTKKYGEPKVDAYDEMHFLGIRKHMKYSWRKSHTKISIDYAENILGSSDLLVVYLIFY